MPREPCPVCYSRRKSKNAIEYIYQTSYLEQAHNLAIVAPFSDFVNLLDYLILNGWVQRQETKSSCQTVRCGLCEDLIETPV
jgi:hypothetical protein